MADHEHENRQPRPESELSRARQRKIKRDQQSGVTNSQPAESTGRRTTRSRTSSHDGPSMRESLAATHIKIPTPSMQTIQGKLSSRLGRIARQLESETPPIKNPHADDAPVSRSSRRKSEAYRDKNIYQATPRAETQRKSSADRPVLPRKNRRLYDARSEVSPPVMVRGGMGGMAFGRVASSRLHKQKAPKRRYDVPLRVQGAEVRLPSIPMVHLGWRAVSLLMVLMLSASLLLVWKGPVFQVQTIEAEGIKRLTTSDLNAVMGTVGASVFTLDPNLLEKSLEQAFPELSKISVRINLPASVKVNVIERVPIIAWTQDDTELWLDAEGISFPPRGNPENALVRVEGHGTPPGLDLTTPLSDVKNLPPGVPTAINPSVPRIKLGADLITSILSLGAKMPADTLLVYDSEHGLGWNDPNGWEVYFGREDQEMGMKLVVYQTLVEHLQSEGIQPALISVEYVHAPYYRMER